MPLTETVLPAVALIAAGGLGLVLAFFGLSRAVLHWIQHETPRVEAIASMDSMVLPPDAEVTR